MEQTFSNVQHPDHHYRWTDSLIADNSIEVVMETSIKNTFYWGMNIFGNVLHNYHQ